MFVLQCKASDEAEWCTLFANKSETELHKKKLIAQEVGVLAEDTVFRIVPGYISTP